MLARKWSPPRLLFRSAFGGNEFEYVELRFEIGFGHDQPPAPRADPLEVAGDVALLVEPILQPAMLVPEHECAEENFADRIAGEDDPDLALGSGQLAE